MNPRVINVIADTEMYTLLLQFSNQECKQFDVKPYLEKGFFTQLKDKAYFDTVRVVLGSVTWPNGQDFCPDTLFELGEPVEMSDFVEPSVA